jgi:Gram-negative bacterial TonB protein C-terminal
MTLRSYIIGPERLSKANFCTPLVLFACVIILLAAAPLAAQRVAIIAPDKADQSRELADRLRLRLEGKVRTLDEMLSTSAFDSLGTDSPFNLTADDTKRVSSAIGCDFLILVRSATQRRSASGRLDYYEANAAIFVASARTGSLTYFKLLRLEAAKPVEAAEKLMRSADDEAAKIADRIKETIKAELTDTPPPATEQVPEANTPAAKNFRPPVPYRRIKPIYTDEAAFYDIKATVDIEVDLRADGSIAATRIMRWAGYGLDDSVETAVRSMNWRPAERSGKSIPIRFLIRYNFKRIEKGPGES